MNNRICWSVVFASIGLFAGAAPLAGCDHCGSTPAVEDVTAEEAAPEDEAADEAEQEGDHAAQPSPAPSAGQEAQGPAVQEPAPAPTAVAPAPAQMPGSTPTGTLVPEAAGAVHPSEQPTPSEPGTEQGAAR